MSIFFLAAVLMILSVLMFCLSPTQSKFLVKSLYFVKEGIPSIQMKAVTQVLQVPKWAFKRKNTEQTNTNRPFSVSAAPLSECCSLLWASQYPVKAVWLHPRGPAVPAAACWWRQKEKNTLCKVISELMFPLRGWHIVVGLAFCAYSVMVVSRSLSLRFWSSRCASFSCSCERVVSRQTSNSCTLSWSWATCCSASRSWCKTKKQKSKFNYLNQRRCGKIGRNGSYLLVLALVVLQGGQVSQIALQSLDTLLVLSLQFRFLLTLLLQIVDVLVSTADLCKWENMLKCGKL